MCDRVLALRWRSPEREFVTPKSDRSLLLQSAPQAMFILKIDDIVSLSKSLCQSMMYLFQLGTLHPEGQSHKVIHNISCELSADGYIEGCSDHYKSIRASIGV